MDDWLLLIEAEYICAVAELDVRLEQLRELLNG